MILATSSSLNLVSS